MDKKLHKLLEDLKSSSYRQVHQALTELRSLLQTQHRPTSAAQKLRKIGITKLLLRFLKKKYEKLMYLSLSILGTCSLELETRVLLHHEEIPKVLVSLHAEFSSELIRSRIYRCIGNLAAFPNAAIEFHECGAVKLLVTAITPSEESQPSSDTVQMAVRAIRTLGDTEEHRQFLLLDNALRVITDLLNSDDGGIVKACLKTLITCCTSIEGAVQVQKGCNGNGFEKLVSLTKSGPKPELALWCLCNIAQVGSCRPDLGKAGTITAIFDQLKKMDHKSEPRTLVTALCLFCSEIVNRVRMRDNNHLKDLLDLYTNDRYSYLEDVLLVGIAKFVYDDISLKILIDNGLVTILISKLKKHIFSLYPIHHDLLTNKCPDSSRRLSFETDFELDKSPSWQLSVSPISSTHNSPNSVAGPSSPNSCMSSPPRSPLCWSPAYSNCSGQTETYSPVYEDSSEDDTCEDLLGDPINVPKEEEHSLSQKSNIFILLSRISNHDWAIQELMSADAIKTLLAYLVIGRVYISKTTTILSTVISSFWFLAPLIHQRFAITVFTKLCMRKHEGDCSACNVHEKIGKHLLDRAASVAEGPYAEGKIAYILQRGSVDEIKAASLTIPFVIRRCWLLKKLLVNHKGLSTILSLVTDADEKSQAILALSRLSDSLRVTVAPYNTCDEVLFPYYIPSENEQCEIVTFRLDDGSFVQADKKALGEASDVFNSMLNGAFRESRENVVTLKDVSKETLTLLLLSCRSYYDTKELVLAKPDVAHVLELFVVSDKFLITSLNCKLLDYIKNMYFNADQFINLYSWCSTRLDCMVPEIVSLYEDACSYLLIGQMKHKTRIQIYDSIIRAGFWEELQSYLSRFLIYRMEEADFE